MRSLEDKQIRWLSVVFMLIALVIIVRLFVMQVYEHTYYDALATGTHEIYERLFPTRGTIYFQDTRTNAEYPVAVNKDFYLIYAVPKEIKPADVVSTTDKLAAILKVDDIEKQKLLEKLSKIGDVYESVAKKQPENVINEIKAQGLPGIHATAQTFRYYPENDLAGNILGFTGFDDNGNLVGSYGVEGYWNKIISGRGGFLFGEKGAKGGWIALAGRTLTPAEDGADLVLTIDRAIEFKACERLKVGMEEYKAKSASLTLLDPKTGAIIAMCSYPSFDPNNYSKVEDERAFNNTNIFTPYEPGSVFKPITMSAALDLNLVNPNTTFTDPCTRKFSNFTIHNALNKCHGTITMTNVLENSVNTGMIWVEEKIGQDKFHEYVDKFGFGQKIGATMNTEAKGNVDQLDRKRAVDYATASFGQGITVTPLQLAMAYGALANGGRMFKPYVVSEVRYANGKKEKTEPEMIDNVVSEYTSKIITGMLTSVVEKTYFRSVKMKDYFIAGKTGTAQIPGPGGYSEETNHTFAGYFPAENPRWVMIVKYEAPERQWAESTAAPVFKDVADFVLDYYAVKKER